MVLGVLVQTEFQEVPEGAQVEGDNDLGFRIIGQYTPSHFRFEVHGAFLCDSGIIGEGAREHCIAPSLVLFFCKPSFYFGDNDLELVVVSAMSLALLAVSYPDTMAYKLVSYSTVRNKGEGEADMFQYAFVSLSDNSEQEIFVGSFPFALVANSSCPSGPANLHGNLLGRSPQFGVLSDFFNHRASV